MDKDKNYFFCGIGGSGMLPLALILKGLGCRVDRHENIGKGAIGSTAFKCLMKDPRFRAVPKVLETPKENDMDLVNLRLLRGFAGVK